MTLNGALSGGGSALLFTTHSAISLSSWENFCGVEREDVKRLRAKESFRAATTTENELVGLHGLNEGSRIGCI